MKYAVIIENAGASFCASVPDLPGCVSTGATYEESLTNIKEAIEFQIDGLREDGLPVPPASTQLEYVDVASA